MDQDKSNKAPDLSASSDVASEEQQPSYMTSEQFNKALSAREKSFEKRLAQQQLEFKEILERIAPPKQVEEKEKSRTSQ